MKYRVKSYLLTTGTIRLLIKHPWYQMYKKNENKFVYLISIFTFVSQSTFNGKTNRTSRNAD